MEEKMKKLTKIFLFLVFIIFLDVSEATIWSVPEFLQHIQEMIAYGEVIDGDTVSVLNGDTLQPTVYPETINFIGKNILVVNRGCLNNQGSPKSIIIDGQHHGSVVTFSSGETQNAILRGFTIINGNYIDGGGIRCVRSSPRIENNIIRNNGVFDTTNRGGGIAILGHESYPDSTRPVIFNNVIRNNKANESGGGIFYNNAHPIIASNKIIRDSVNWAGGGIASYDDTLGNYNTYIVNNQIDSNVAGLQGRALYFQTSDAIIRNNRIRYNNNQSISSNSGGIYCVYVAPDFGDVNSDSGLGYNWIENNGDTNIITESSMHADGNFWGSVNTSDIRKRICGNVDFDPITASDKIASVTYSSRCSTDVVVTGDLTVGSGVTLTVLPGKTFKFSATADTNTGDYSVCELLVKGKLYAIGTSVNEVKFTSNATSPQSGNWYGIRLKSNSIGRFNNCQVKYGYCGIEAISNDTLFVDSSLIQSNQAYGINIIGAQSAEIKESEFYDDIRGIYCTNNTAPVIVNNKFQNLSYGISLAEINDATISNNYINGIAQATQMLYGITIGSVGQGVHVDSNTVMGASQAGIYCHGDAYANIYRDTLLSNSYYGVLCYYSSSPTIRWCTIANHDEGVFCEYESYPDLGDTNDRGNNSIDTNNIYYVINKNENQNEPIKAIMNWWGTDEPAPDKFGGIVNYEPWLKEPPEGGGQSAGTINIAYPFMLYAPKPNPTSREVKIAYSLPNRCHAELIIYNTSGRVITKTVEDKEAGCYEYTWNNHKFPNGVYIIRLKADNKFASQKVITAK